MSTLETAEPGEGQAIGDDVRQGFSAGGLPLPLEMFSIIGEFLVGENNFASLANLNVANSLIREATNAVLWTIVTLDAVTPRWNATLEKAHAANLSGSYSDAKSSMAEISKRSTRFKAESDSLPTNCKYVKFLFWTVRCGIPQTLIPSIFPNIKLCIMHGKEGGIDRSQHALQQMVLEGPRVLSVCVYQPVGSQLLFNHILRTPIRGSNQWPYMSGTIVTLPCWMSVAKVYKDAFIFDAETSNPQPFDSAQVLLQASRTLVLFPEPGGRCGSNNTALNTAARRSERIERTLTSLWGLAGRMIPSCNQQYMASHSPLFQHTRDLGVYFEDYYYDPFEYARMLVHLDAEQLIPLANRIPDMANNCPDILRNRLGIICKLTTLPETLLRVVQQFQRSYAERFDILPVDPPDIFESLVNITRLSDRTAILAATVTRHFRGHEDERDRPALDELDGLAAVVVGPHGRQWHRSVVPVNRAL